MAAFSEKATWEIYINPRLRTITALLALLAIFALSCGSRDNEALRLGQNYFQESLLKCGDTWAGKGASFVQMKGIGFVLHRKELTQADQANGIEWLGHVELRGEIFRHYNGMYGRWEEWRNWPLMPWEMYWYFSPTVDITRSNGTWQVGPKKFVPKTALEQSVAGVLAAADRSLNKVNFTCAQIPK